MKEQAELEFRSIVNSQRDKGYKTLNELIAPDGLVKYYIEEVDPMDHALIDELLPKGKTYVGGVRKVMLAKDPKKVKKYYIDDKTPNPVGWNRDWWVSRKLDGIRAGIYLEDGKLKAISRNGKDLSVPLQKIFKSKKWMSFFKKLGEGVMVDGEIYKHGMTLQQLSGASQLKDYDEDRHGQLEFWIFDYADDELTCDERIIKLNSLQGHFDEKVDQIRINGQVKFMGYESIKKIHDIWVQDGFEGAIARDAARMYGYGTKDDRMIKVKEFDDDEFEIIGMTEGLRTEDMCFKCKLPNGKTFDAKPMGNKELKFQYVRDIDNIIGKMLTVKFFNYTPDGVPFLPTGKAIRDYE